MIPGVSRPVMRTSQQLPEPEHPHGGGEGDGAEDRVHLVDVEAGEQRRGDQRRRPEAQPAHEAAQQQPPEHQLLGDRREDHDDQHQAEDLDGADVPQVQVARLSQGPAVGEPVGHACRRRCARGRRSPGRCPRAPSRRRGSGPGRTPSATPRRGRRCRARRRASRRSSRPSAATVMPIPTTIGTPPWAATAALTSLARHDDRGERQERAQPGPHPPRTRVRFPGAGHLLVEDRAFDQDGRPRWRGTVIRGAGGPAAGRGGDVVMTEPSAPVSRRGSRRSHRAWPPSR